MIALFLAGVTLACTGLPGFSPSGPARLYEGENLFEYMNGNSEGYLIYGFVRMRGITCVKGPEQVLVDISEMADEESAYGIFSSNRDVQREAESIGAGGQVVPRKAIFVKGKYFVEIAAEAQGDHTALLGAAARAMEQTLEGSTKPPEAIGWFPPEGLSAGPPRLTPASVLGVRLLKRGYVAQYGTTKAFVVTETSPQAARDVLAKWIGRFETVGEAKVEGAEDALVVTDKYLGRIVVARRGNRLVGYAGLAEGTDGARLVTSLLARVPR